MAAGVNLFFYSSDAVTQQLICNFYKAKLLFEHEKKYNKADFSICKNYYMVLKIKLLSPLKLEGAYNSKKLF